MKLCGNNSTVIHKPVNQCSTGCCDVPASFFNQLQKCESSFIPYVVDVINAGVNPAGMAIYNNFLYIVNNNNYTIPNQDSVTVVDLSTNLPVALIQHPSFNQPYTITINGNLGYVTNSAGSTVTVLNLDTNTVQTVIPGFDGPSGLTIEDNIGYVINYGATTGIFVGSISGNTLTVTSTSDSINLGEQITTSGTFIGSIAGTVLTVTSITSGVVGIGATITGAGVTPAIVNSLGTGTGGPGTYNISVSQTVASRAMTSTSAGGLTVIPGTVITGYGTALAGGLGTYIVSPSQTVPSVIMGAVTPGVGSGSGNTVTPFNISNNVLGSPITVGQAPAAIVSTPDYIYTINYVDGLPTHGTISRIPVGGSSSTLLLSGLDGPFGIALSPDGNTAYITDFGSNNFMPFGTTLCIVNLLTGTIVTKIPTGIQPSGVAISGRYLYVSNYNTLYTSPNFTSLVAGQGTISIIDLYTNQVVPPTIGVGQSPDYIVINGKYLYVSNYSSNTVTVVQIMM